MFARTKAAWLRSCTVGAVRRLVIKSFALTGEQIRRDNESWEAWIALRNPSDDFRDLCGLLQTDARDSLKARVITILLAPTLQVAPYRRTIDARSSLRDYLSLLDKKTFAGLSTPLQAFIARLVVIYADFALAHLANPNLADRSTNDSIVSALPSYNYYILEALETLAEDDPLADALFQRYQVRDPVAYCGLEDASGYGQFRRLLAVPVPEKWKRLADAEMRGIVRAEAKGEATPRGDWEQALPQYAEALSELSYSGDLRYSTELFASQIDFVLEVAGNWGPARFRQFHLDWIMGRLAGEEHQPLRHRLVRHVVLGEETLHQFSVYDIHSQLQARRFIAEYAGDQGLVTRLTQLLAAYAERQAAQVAAAQASAARADAVMAAMR